MVALSIIIPTFNRREILKQNLLSLAQQTFRDFEVVVADDGSSDGTGKMLSELTLFFPIKHTWEPNAGRSAARNRGVRHASADFFLFIDDHVIADARLLEEHMAWHARFAGTARQIVRGYAPLVQSSADVPEPPPYQDMQIFTFKNEQNPFVSFFTGNVSMTRNAFEKAGGFDENFKEYGFQDSEFGYRLVKAGFQIKVNPNALVWVVSAKLSLEKRFDKSRQAGHSAVVLFRKNKWLGIYVGLNPFNLLLYSFFSMGNRFLLRTLYLDKLPSYSENTVQYDKIVSRIRYYYFLWGMFEKFFNTRSAKDYYAKKNPGSVIP